MPRSFTIKIKVNLHNYENCDLALTDDHIESDADILQMRDDFRRILRMFGQGNDATREAFASYADRVLGPDPKPSGGRPETLSRCPGTVTPSTSDLLGDSPHTSGSGIEQENGPKDDKPDAAPALVQNGESNGNESGPAKRSYKTGREKLAEDKAAFNHAAAETAAHPENVIRGDYQCQECGKDISKTEKDMSLLFAPAPLCKACLKKLQGGFVASKEPREAKS